MHMEATHQEDVLMLTQSELTACLHSLTSSESGVHQNVLHVCCYATFKSYNDRFPRWCMSQRLLHQFESAVTLVYSLLASPALVTYAGVADLDREEVAAFIDKKLPSASAYSKATAGSWADSRYKTLQPCTNFHCQHALQD